MKNTNKIRIYYCYQFSSFTTSKHFRIKSLQEQTSSWLIVCTVSFMTKISTAVTYLHIQHLVSTKSLYTLLKRLPRVSSEALL